jgi:hypothetical protein
MGTIAQELSENGGYLTAEQMAGLLGLTIE